VGIAGADDFTQVSTGPRRESNPKNWADAFLKSNASDRIAMEVTPMISKAVDLELVRLADEAEEKYFRSLPPEHFMEATDHAQQREITLESFALIHEARPDIQCFNELLVQYFRGKQNKKFQGVVPDNMVVVYGEPIQARGSFTIPLQPVGPFLVLEYISESNKQKDYDDNFSRYRKDLKVPYYLLFYPGTLELNVYRMIEGDYVGVEANAATRLPIPELELEVGVLQGWTRFWFRGELLPLPGDLLKQLNAARDQLDAARDQLDTAREQLKSERQAREALEAELARLKKG
jgi:Uma2 family endonuclease